MKVYIFILIIMEQLFVCHYLHKTDHQRTVTHIVIKAIILVFLFVSFSSTALALTQNSSFLLLISSLNTLRVSHSEIDSSFGLTVLVICLIATGKPDVRKPSNVLLKFNPFVGDWLELLPLPQTTSSVWSFDAQL